MEKLHELLGRVIDPVQAAWSNLNEREQRLLGAMGGFFVLLALLVTGYLSSASLAEAEADRDDLRKVLQENDAAAH